jgi:hypothetical protein
MANSPCGGCPPCCAGRVFDSQAVSEVSEMQVIVSSVEYGCIKGYGDVGIVDGQLGQRRSSGFHPVTIKGAHHLRDTGNPLSAHAA